MSKYILADESVIKQVLAAMERVAAELDSPYTSETDEERQLRAAITALRATLAQQTLPAQKPAFHGFMGADGTQMDLCFTPNASRSDGTFATAYYTAPPQQALPVAWVDALKDAFFEGFTSVATYNDTLLNSPEEAWANYKLPHIALERPMQEPAGRVVSANCEYATVQWLKQTSDVGGGDPKNSRSWPIAGDAVYTAPPQRKPLTDEEILEAVGWERAEMYMKLTPNFPVEEARKETIKNARAIERKVRGEEK